MQAKMDRRKKNTVTDLYLNIGGISYQIEGGLYDYFPSRVRNYITDKVENPNVIISYEENENIKIPDCIILKKDSFRYFCESEENFINYDQLSESSYSALMELKKDGSYVTCSLKDVEDLGGASLSIRSFNMIGEVIKNTVILNDGLCIHSSSLSYNNSGVIFSAPSGTGKSTHTRLWQKVFDGVEIINDDMPVIRKIDGVWNLCGSPWSGKTEINTNKKVPLKAIVFLERGEKNEITEIGVPECVFKIIGQTLLPVYKQMTKKVMDNISSLVQSVPVYRLKCNISDEAPLTVARKLGLIKE